MKVRSEFARTAAGRAEDRSPGADSTSGAPSRVAGCATSCPAAGPTAGPASWARCPVFCPLSCPASCAPGRWAAAGAAAAFAVVPIHVEPVAWVMGRKDLLVLLGQPVLWDLKDHKALRARLVHKGCKEILVLPG